VSQKQRSRLLHDVGKYVARTARNLDFTLPVPPEPALVAMLACDLYALRDGRRASAVLDELSVGLSGPSLERARARLAEADALEPRLRAGDPAAVARGAAIACEVEALLRALVEETP
jgi:hypothetical protein